MTDWTRKKSRKKYALLIIPILFVGYYFVYLPNGGAEALAQYKTIDEVENITELKTLNNLINEKKLELYQLYRDEAPQNEIAQAENELIQMTKDLDVLVNAKDTEFRKFEGDVKAFRENYGKDKRADYEWLSDCIERGQGNVLKDFSWDNYLDPEYVEPTWMEAQIKNCGVP